MKGTIAALSGLVIASLIMAGCEKSTDPASQNNGTLSLGYRYSPLLPSLSIMKGYGTAAVDSIVITRARFSIRDVTFKSANDSLEYLTAPAVLDLDLASAHQGMSSANVPYGTYDRIEFDVHRVETLEVSALPTAQQAAFADFLAGERYSIIIEGTVYVTGSGPAAFVYRSKIDAKQVVDLVPSITISETSPTANVTILLSSGGWFTSITGPLLDPNDPNNEGAIDENLKSSIRVFKDNDQNGSNDPS